LPTADIRSVTPTICSLFGVTLPVLSTDRKIDRVLNAAAGGASGRIDRCLLYTPDAIGTAVYRANRALFEPVPRLAPIEVPILSVVPPKTPVCYASMFSGASPESHGIRTYIKKVLTCETLFDVMVRAGKRAAVVAVAGSSMDILFRGRAIDYFSEPYDDDVTERVIDLVEADEHDLLIAYHQEYDDTLHEGDPRSREALAAVGNHIRSFVRLVDACDSAWERHTSLVMFAPDHGAHLDPSTGVGTHGENIPQDMQVTHFFRISPAG
jgi:hypothetical protein